MNAKGLLPTLSAGSPDQTMAAVNSRLTGVGISITHDDALMLARQRAESLAAVERVEFGTPAVVAIAEAIESSPFLMQHSAAATLAYLQEAFYELRDELAVDVPDAEIVEALRTCLDELGDATEVAAMPADELMSYSKDYVHAQEKSYEAGYRIIDDEGRAYTFEPTGWDYDEMAPGWDGEGWADAWDD